MAAGALVLGATGFVGREVVRQLCARGGARTVIAHVRPDSSQLAEWRGKFEALGARVDTTAWEVPALTAMVREREVEVVYILIGTTRGRAKQDKVEHDDDIYERVDLGLTKLAVEAVLAEGGARQVRIVYLSGIGADPAARGKYMAARGKAEEVVKAAANDRVTYMIARPAIITGERDDSRIGERTGAIVGDGLLAVVGLFGGKGVRDRYRSTTPDVLAAALIELGEEPAASANRAVDGRDLR